MEATPETLSAQGLKFESTEERQDTPTIMSSTKKTVYGAPKTFFPSSTGFKIQTGADNRCH